MNILKKYLYIDNFDTNLIDKQDQNTGIIFRNYKTPLHLDTIIMTRDYCKKNGKKFYLSNNFKLALKLDLDGAYLPSFNSSFDHLSYSLKTKFLLLGSAHSLRQIKTKELQKVKVIFISSIKKNFRKLRLFLFLLYLKKKII